VKVMTVTGIEMLKLAGKGELVPQVKKDNEFIRIICDGINHFYPKYDLSEGTFVYAVLKNRDFIEGGGPMVLHKIFKRFDKAVSYIMGQDGIYSSKQYVQTYAGVAVDGEPFAWTSFNGYEIRIVKIEE